MRISRLRGLVTEIEQDEIIVDVNGIGYAICCSFSTLNTFREGELVSIFIEATGKDYISQVYYGFSSRNEREVFKLLIAVPGVGGKMAMAILNTLSLARILETGKDGQAIFKTVPGIGTKLAGRIANELGNNKQISLIRHNLLSGESQLPQKLLEEAISALLNLGFDRREASTTLITLMEENSSINFDALVRLALSKLARR